MTGITLEVKCSGTANTKMDWDAKISQQTTGDSLPPTDKLPS